MRILLTGASGRLGRILTAELAAAEHSIAALTRAELDITSPRQVGTVFDRLEPDVVANCSAYNAVDAAETDPVSAFAANAEGVAVLASAASAARALFIHYSTDFVFDGRASEPYDEEAEANPLGVYGASKLAGEQEARTVLRHYVIRVSSLFGGEGVRGHIPTIDRIADSLLEGRSVRAFADRTVSPSYAADVARATRALIERRVPYGTYHAVNGGHATWDAVAREIARQLGVAASVEAARAGEMATTAAPRPNFCALSNAKLAAAGIVMPSWQSALRRHLRSRSIAIPRLAAATG